MYNNASHEAAIAVTNNLITEIAVTHDRIAVTNGRTNLKLANTIFYLDLLQAFESWDGIHWQKNDNRWVHPYTQNTLS